MMNNAFYDELLKDYKEKAEIYEHQYELMGRLLDYNGIIKRFKKKGIFSIYIYGGGFLGIQLFKTIRDSDIRICGIIDKFGKLKFDVLNVAVYSMTDFESYYDDEYIIITPVQFYKEIYEDLVNRVDKEKILFLSEFLY